MTWTRRCGRRSANAVSADPTRVAAPWNGSTVSSDIGEGRAAAPSTSTLIASSVSSGSQRVPSA